MIEHNHAWGESWDIYRDKSVWVVGFRGRKGGASSEHYHRNMSQVIVVVHGSVATRNGTLRILKSGDGRLITPLESHLLQFLKDSEGIETYYALPGHEIDPADIVRLSPAKAPE